MKKTIQLTILAASFITVSALFVNCASSTKTGETIAQEYETNHTDAKKSIPAPNEIKTTATPVSETRVVEQMDQISNMHDINSHHNKIQTYQTQKSEKYKATDQSTNYSNIMIEAPLYENRLTAPTIAHNPVHNLKLTKDEPVSTFSVDVDTSSFSQIQQYLDNGQLPPKELVRTEEVINYFNYDYLTPSTLNSPIALNANLIMHPFKANTHLLQLGLKAFEVKKEELPAMNLVLLIDVSGSMSSQDKLPLLMKGMDVLIEQLDEDDKVSIVTYAGRAAVLAEGISGNNKQQLHKIIHSLNSGGSTHGSAGIKQAYDLAKQFYIQEGVNRVVLATDGDFNVGLTGVDSLKTFVSKQANDAIYLSAIGFGHSGYNDAIMEEISNAGEGNAYFVNDYNQARRIFSEQLPSMTLSVASDVKVQVEFNPQYVLEYRLIGYNNRRLNREDFNNDKIDAAEMGAGHTVTALYEITLQGDTPNVDPLRYQNEGQALSIPTSENTEIAYFKARYKLQLNQSSEKITLPILNTTKASNTDSLILATSAMQFAENLKSDQTQKSDYDLILNWLANIDNSNSEVALLTNMIHNAKSLLIQY
ncbi:vWA domain-containing protein [Marinicellulosiphila megalodicopiae]|uniref:vWA domain-containing protein n=1 Tax=Marinicellulosiphila megalodicopiae TaxID=2724896 RepID=UPI003BAE9FBB